MKEDAEQGAGVAEHTAVRWLAEMARVFGGMVSMPLFFHPFDLRAELAELFVEMFVAAIDVVDAVHFRHAFRF